MALKFEIINNALVVTDTVDSSIKFDRPAKDTYYQSYELDNGNIVLYDISGVNSYASQTYKTTLAGAVDSTLTPFTAETFRTFVRENLGKSNPQASGQTEIWELYGHSGATYSYTAITSDPFKLPNDGVYVNSYNLANSFNTTTNQLDLSNLVVNSVIELTVDFLITTTSPNQEVIIKLFASIGDPNAWSGILGTPTTFKTAKTHELSFHIKIPIEFQSDLDNPAELILSSDADMTVQPRFLFIASKKVL